MRIQSMVGVFLLAGCGANWKEADSASGGANPPEVYLTEPGVGSTWTTIDDIPVIAVVTDDGTDPEDIDVTIRSDIDGDIATVALTSDGQLQTTIKLTEGTHTLSLVAVDAGGHEGEDTSTLRVIAGSRPSQPAIRIDPSAPVTGDTLVATIVAESTDAEGDPITYTWSWTVDDVDASITTETVPGDDVTMGQIWTATLVASDGTITSEPASRSVTVGNAPPNPGEITILPENPSGGVELSCDHAEIVDAEGDAFTTSYAWWVVDVITPDTGGILPAGSATRGQEVWCEVVVNDGTETRWPSNVVRIGNSAPTATAAVITPSSGDRTTAFSCVATGPADVDGDAVTFTYRWLVNDVEAATGSTIPAESFVRADVLVCEATPADAYSVGVPVLSTATTIENAVPTAPEVAFVRADVVPGVTAECEVVVEATDADGDTVSYVWSWTVNGAEVEAFDPTYATTGLASGDVLVCTAVAQDGLDSGGRGSATLTLGTATRGTIDTTGAWTTLVGTASASGQFGKALDDVADFDGDGLPELIVASPRGDGSTQGAVFVFTSGQLAAGGTLADTDAAIALYGHSNNDYLGATRGASGVGDVDGDGLGDFMAAAPYEDQGGQDAGQVYLMYGGGSWGFGDDIQGASDARFRGDTGAWLGARTTGADVDADGIDDLILAGPYADDGAEKAGALAVYLSGGSRFSATYDLDDADAIVTGINEDDELGWSLAAGGDGDGDGYQDVAVGVFYDDENGEDAGSAAVISGSDLGGTETYDSAAYLVIHGLAAEDRFGYDVATPGDIDGDGLADFLIGSYLSDESGEDAGAVALFYGVAGTNREVDADAADATFWGEAAGDQFGAVIDGAGDFDGDGLADFLIGAGRAVSGTLAEAGAGYLFLGQSAGAWGDGTGAAQADLKVAGMADADWLGDEVAGGLDLDGNGLSDIAIAAQKADAGASDGGAVYVFVGP